MLADATPLRHTFATWCEVYIHVWIALSATLGVRHSVTWWTMDGPTNANFLRVIVWLGDLTE